MEPEGMSLSMLRCTKYGGRAILVVVVITVVAVRVVTVVTFLC